MAEVSWTAEALADIASIRAYIAQYDPDAARRVSDGCWKPAIVSRFSHIAEARWPAAAES